MIQRRNYTHRTLAARLLVRIGFWFLALLGVVTCIVFWLTYEKEQQQHINTLLTQLQHRIDHKSDALRRTEQSAHILAKEFLEHYQRRDTSALVKKFEQRHQETNPGVLRLKPAFFDGIQAEEAFYQHISTFIGPRQQPIDDELKARIVLAEKVLNDLAPGWTPWVLNTHLSMPENVLSMHSVDSDWGLQARADLVITDFSVVRSSLMSENPQRKPNWTGLYYDLSAKRWTLTYQKPVDLNGQHLLNASHDIDLSIIVDELVTSINDGSQHFIVNQRQELIAQQQLPDDEFKKAGVVKLSELGQSKLSKAYDIVSQLAEKTAPWVNTTALDENIIVAMPIDGPDWWHITLYPKQNIRDEALTLPLTITFVALGLLFSILVILHALIRRHIAEPLEQLAAMASRVGQEQYHQVLEEHGLADDAKGEVGLLVRSLKTMATRMLNAKDELEQKVIERTEQLEKVNTRLDRLAHLDGLTQLMNRRAFDRDLQAAIEGSGQQPKALALGDLDKFKPYNDNYGHESGDRALKQVSKALVEAKVGQVYRYGGEEIAILLDAEDLKRAYERVEYCRAKVEALAIEHCHQPNERQVLTISFGVLMLTNERDNAAHINQVDHFLYESKDIGGNAVSCHHAEPNEQPD